MESQTLTGEVSGKNAGENIDPEIPVAAAVEAAKIAAEHAALKVKSLFDLAAAEAEKIGASAGELNGKLAGETEGETVALQQAVDQAKKAATEAAILILGERGAPIGEAVREEFISLTNRIIVNDSRGLSSNF